MHTYRARFRKGSNVHEYSYSNVNFGAHSLAQAADIANRYAVRHSFELVGVTLRDA